MHVFRAGQLLYMVLRSLVQGFAGGGCGRIAFSEAADLLLYLGSPWPEILQRQPRIAFHSPPVKQQQLGTLDFTTSIDGNIAPPGFPSIRLFKLPHSSTQSKLNPGSR